MNAFDMMDALPKEKVYHQISGIKIIPIILISDWSICAQHCKVDPIYVFPEIKMCGHVLNSYVHVSVSGLYIATIVHLFSVGQQVDRSCEHINLS